MQISKVFSVALLSTCFSFSAYAAEILSSRTEKSPGVIDGGVIEITKGKSNFFGKNSLVQTTASARDVHGYVNENVYIYSDHGTYVQNTTPYYQNYTIYVKLSSNGNYIDHSYTVRLAPRETWQAFRALFLVNNNYSTARTYDILAYTKISGETSNDALGRGVARIDMRHK